MPALLIRISTPPKALVAPAMSCCAPSQVRTSAPTGNASPPAARISSAAAAARCSDRPLVTTFAPSSANFLATSSPMPPLEPVMTTILSAKRSPTCVITRPPLSLCNSLFAACGPRDVCSPASLGEQDGEALGDVLAHRTFGGLPVVGPQRPKQPVVAIERSL